MNKVYILDFFGTTTLKPALKIDLRTRILTAYTTEYNTFLGFYLRSPTLQHSLGQDNKSVVVSSKKKNQGVIWGEIDDNILHIPQYMWCYFILIYMYTYYLLICICIFIHNTY